jgi:hypothetical protein
MVTIYNGEVSHRLAYVTPGESRATRAAFGISPPWPR